MMYSDAVCLSHSVFMLSCQEIHVWYIFLLFYEISTVLFDQTCSTLQTLGDHFKERAQTPHFCQRVLKYDELSLYDFHSCNYLIT